MAHTAVPRCQKAHHRPDLAQMRYLLVLFLSDPAITDPEPELPLPEQFPLSSSIAEAPLLRLAGVTVPPPPPLK